MLAESVSSILRAYSVSHKTKTPPKNREICMTRKTLSLTLFSILASFTLLISAQLVLAEDSNCAKETLGDGQIKYNCDFTNPIVSKSLTDLLQSVFTQIKPFAIFLAVFALIIAGFLYVWAAGAGSGRITQKSKDLIRYAFIGALIIAAAPAILEAIKQFAEKIK